MAPTPYLLEHRGRSQSVRDWARETGLSAWRIYARLRSGWPVEDALAVRPPRVKHRGRLLTHRGLTLPLTAWAARVGLSPFTIRWRLRAGWSVAKALDTPLLPRGGNRRKEATLDRG